MSGIGNYAVASSANATELAESLTSADVTVLAAELATTGLHDWLRWQSANAGEIEDFVQATPTQRAKKKRWHDPALRRRLVLASITHCQAAHALLDFLHQRQYDLSPGGSYRDTTALAGRLYWELMGIEIPDWPEPFERVCPSPFDAPPSPGAS